MSAKDGEAKVFGDGDVTIVINQIAACARVYIGTQQVGLIQGLNLSLDVNSPAPQLEIKFPSSNNEQLQLMIEEQVRAVKQLQWVKVSR